VPITCCVKILVLSLDIPCLPVKTTGKVIIQICMYVYICSSLAFLAVVFNTTCLFGLTNTCKPSNNRVIFTRVF